MDELGRRSFDGDETSSLASRRSITDAMSASNSLLLSAQTDFIVLLLSTIHACFVRSFADGRCNGSFEKHCSKKSSSSSDTPAGSGGCGSCTMLYMALSGCKSKYGGRPVSNSITTHPKLHISDATVTSWSSTTSGAIQYGVPATSPSSSSSSSSFFFSSPVSAPLRPSSSSPSITPPPNVPPPPRSSSSLAATPKSASLTSPSLFVRMFAPLMSRCVIPIE